MGPLFEFAAGDFFFVGQKKRNLGSGPFPRFGRRLNALCYMVFGHLLANGYIVARNRNRTTNFIPGAYCCLLYLAKLESLPRLILTFRSL